MDCIEQAIKLGKQHKLCPNCNNELTIVICGGLFGERYKKIKESGIKYTSGCCYDQERYCCEDCKEYYDGNFKSLWKLQEYYN